MSSQCETAVLISSARNNMFVKDKMKCLCISNNVSIMMKGNMYKGKTYSGYYEVARRNTKVEFL